MDAKSEIIDEAFSASRLDYSFRTKPVVVGGLAMEYYGLRKHGGDIDLIVTDEDYQALARRFPSSKKDSWGDLGVSIEGWEMLRSIWRMDYGFYAEGSAEYADYRVISLEKLFLMKALAMDAEAKHKMDFDLILRHYIKVYQKPELVRYMNEHLEKYLSVPGGIVYNDAY